MQLRRLLFSHSRCTKQAFYRATQNTQIPPAQGQQAAGQTNSLNNTSSQSQPPSSDKPIPYTRLANLDVEGDEMAYTSRVQWNSLKRLHLRHHSTGRTDKQLTEQFLQRVQLLSTQYSFFKRANFYIDEPPSPEDNELYYDVEKFQIIPYLKRLFFSPEKPEKQDEFPKFIIALYFCMLVNWFVIDVVVFKWIYSDNEIKGYEADKKYFKSQLKGQEKKVEIQDSKAYSERDVYKFNLTIESIKNEINKVKE